MQRIVSRRTNDKQKSMCDIAEVYDIEQRRARKDHRCEECRGTITAGEIYHYHHGVFDGAGFSNKLCEECQQLHNDVDKDNRDIYEQTCVGELCEAIFETGDHDLMRRFIETKIKRGCPVQSWMTERLAESANDRTERPEAERNK